MRVFSFLKSALVCSAVLVAGRASADATKSIVQNAVDAGQFKTLVALVQKAGLVDALNAPGPLTVFAPTDAAFAKLSADTLYALENNPEALKKVLLRHVASGKFTADRIGLRKEVKALEGVVGCSNVDRCFYNGQLLLSVLRSNGTGGDPVRVIAEDIAASNGIIQAIDTVLLPAATR